MVFVCRSLGLTVNISEDSRINLVNGKLSLMLRAAINDNVKQIPCLLERKETKNRVIQCFNLTLAIDTKKMKIIPDMP